MILLTDDALEVLTTFVRGGGIFVCGFFSGVVDENDHVRSPQQAAELRRLLGVRVDEFWPIPPGEEVAVELASGETAVARDWSEWLEPDGGEPVAHYSFVELPATAALVLGEIPLEPLGVAIVREPPSGER